MSSTLCVVALSHQHKLSLPSMLSVGLSLSHPYPLSLLSMAFVRLSHSYPDPLSLPSILCAALIQPSIPTLSVTHNLCVAPIQSFMSTLSPILCPWPHSPIYTHSLCQPYCVRSPHSAIYNSLPIVLCVWLPFNHPNPFSVSSTVCVVALIHQHTLSLPSMLSVGLSLSHPYPLSLPSMAFVRLSLSYPYPPSLPSILCAALIQPSYSLSLPSISYAWLPFSHSCPLCHPCCASGHIHPYIHILPAIDIVCGLNSAIHTHSLCHP